MDCNRRNHGSQRPGVAVFAQTVKQVGLSLALFLFAAVASAANVHVFLMAGRDRTPFSFGTDARILNFSDGRAGSALNQIEVATDPLRHDKNGHARGTNMGRPFARALLATLPAGDKILLVNRAWGGTSIDEWNKNHGPTGYQRGSGYNAGQPLQHRNQRLQGRIGSGKECRRHADQGRHHLAAGRGRLADRSRNVPGGNR